jgi:hypothetical protein
MPFERRIGMGNQYTLKVYPAGMSRTVYRVLQISGQDTLDTLCHTIITAFRFIDEHLYEFCMDNKMYSDDSYQSDPEYEDEPSTDIDLEKLDLVKGQNFTLHYDFGDDWMFTIHVQKIGEAKEYAKAKVIKQKGEVQQYPDWDDDEDSEEDW